MDSLFWIYLIICCLLVLISAYYFIFCNDKNAKVHIRTFIWIKGVLYLLLAIVTTVAVICKDEYSAAAGLTIYVAVFEAAQNIFQVKAEDLQEKAKEKLDDYPANKDFTLLQIEKIFMFCSEVLEPLRQGMKTEETLKLAYEQIYDYLKYYSCSEKFFDTFANYAEGKCDFETVDQALCDWKENLSYNALKIVKVPER